MADPYIRERSCAHCGRTFGARRHDERFCSNVCRQRAYRRRRQGVEETIPTPTPAGSHSLADRANTYIGDWFPLTPASDRAAHYARRPQLQRYARAGVRR